MRVLRISHSATVDAYRERDRQLSAREGIDLELITPEHWEHLGGRNEQISEQFPVHRAATYGTGNIPLFAFDANVIKNALVRFKPDIVDIHEEPYSVSGFESVGLAQMYAKSAACVFYSAQNILKHYPPPFCWSEQYVFKNSYGSYPCSEGVKDVLAAKGFDTNTDVIPLGVDLSTYEPLGPKRRSDYQFGERDFVIGYFGRVETYKGVQFLIQALGQMKKSDWRLLIVGSGAYESELRTLANGLGVSDRIIWAGAVDGSDVPAYMRSCDLIAVPSMTTKTWKEQFGRIVVESIACGVPVVAFDSGSLPEVVDDVGLIVREGDLNELCLAIDRFYSDIELRKSLREKGLDKARTQYSWSRVAEEMHMLYARARALRVKRRS